MLKKIFMTFAVFLVAAQFSVASADVAGASRFRRPIIPITVSATISETAITFKVSRELDVVKSYVCKIYRTSNEEFLGELQGTFSGSNSFAKFEYKDLLNDSPENLTLQFKLSIDDDDDDDYHRRRRILENLNYDVKFQRGKDGKLAVEIIYRQ